jgi:hypothetical protein
MKKLIIISAFTFLYSNSILAQLKSVVYDFDGMGIGSNVLPDGDYTNADMTYEGAANPLQGSDMLGDRVLKMKLNWNAGVGEFGKAMMRFVELDATVDYLNFYIYNPTGNSGAANLKVLITEDDNQNNIYEHGSDDKWVYTITIPQSGNWQLVSVPLSSFTDDNLGGNGVFDAAYTNAAGMLFSVGFVFTKPVPSASVDNYFIDMICFSEGPLPTGNSILELPPSDPSAICQLGVLTENTSPDLSPAEIESMMPAGKKLTYVNWFVFYANTGTQANVFTDNEVQNLINQGYKPIITWETMFKEFPRLDPVQPKLNDIVNGSFNTYIDAFAMKIKSYNGNVILRILHEFEGDWYSWSLTHNGQNPQLYIQAYRYIVDRFNMLGVTNVEWMWCVNAEPKPYAAYNWIKNAYPGDNYVNIVATDIYNHPDLGTPAWKSFRYTMAESYYYLMKNFPSKPLYICEVGCRERNLAEPSGNQTKADWICMMNKDLKTFFNKTKALVFFSIVKEHDWRINSSNAAKQAFIDCIWSDSFYGEAVSVKENFNELQVNAFPNPFQNTIQIKARRDFQITNATIKLFDVSGRLVLIKENADLTDPLLLNIRLTEGVYTIEIIAGEKEYRRKMIKS